MPKPEDNHGFDVSQLVQSTKDKLPEGDKLGPAIHAKLGDIQHPHNASCPINVVAGYCQ